MAAGLIRGASGSAGAEVMLAGVPGIGIRGLQGLVRGGRVVRVHGLVVLSPEQPVLPLGLVLHVLDAQKSARSQQRQDEADHERALLIQLGRAHGPGHAQAAADEDQRVDAAERLIQELVSVDEDLGMIRSVHRIGAEQPSEHQDFGGEEDPHAQLARLVLLARGGIVMSQVRIVGVGVALGVGLALVGCIDDVAHV